MDRKRLGAIGEEFAALVLEAEGCRILARNYRCPLGEIDLICAQGGEILFVEVKTRETAALGLPQEAVGREKQHRIRRIAMYYLKECGTWYSTVRFLAFAIRFDRLDFGLE